MAQSGTNRDRRAAPFRTSAITRCASRSAGIARAHASVRRASIGPRRLGRVISPRAASMGSARICSAAAPGSRNRRVRRHVGVLVEVAVVLVGEVVRDGVQARRQHAGAQETENARGKPGAC